MGDFKSTEKVSTSNVRAGDCVFIHGKWKTVCAKDIKRGFMGVTIFGDPLAIDGRKIERALFPKYYKGKLIGVYSQTT